MRYVALGGLRASVVGLGLWQFGTEQWRLGPDLGESAAGAIVQRALDLGVNLFDTAEIYGQRTRTLGADLRARVG
jgi:aryl-alcohol dehydrogenase-like predicted oxidoreductase